MRPQLARGQRRGHQGHVHDLPAQVRLREESPARRGASASAGAKSKFYIAATLGAKHLAISVPNLSFL